MKLFVSYSRDDKAWVYILWRALRDEGGHDAWIDQRIVPAQDWWNTILENIENAECVIYIMSPKAVESIYCGAELSYALALNKPILPLMLKQCDYPAELGHQRVQFQIISDSMNLHQVLYKIEQGLGQVQRRLDRGEFLLQNSPRPPVPTPEKKPEQISEVFMLAEETAAENNISLAEKLFQQVINSDPGGWGLAAAERLAEIRFERGRNSDYLNIVQMAKNPALIKGARAAAKVFTQKYGEEYDPNGVFSGLRSQSENKIGDNAQPANVVITRITDQSGNSGFEPEATENQLTSEEYFARGRTLRGNSYERIADFTEAIRLNPQYADAYNERGFLRYHDGDHVRALADFTEAIRLNPQHAIAYNNRGIVRHYTGNIEGAIVDYSEAIRLNPQYASAYYNRGLAHKKKGNLDEAIVDYSEVIRLNPQYIDAYYNRGLARKMKGDIKSSCEDYEQVLKLDLKYKYAYEIRDYIAENCG